MCFGDFFDFDGNGDLSTMELSAGFALTASIMDDIERDERARARAEVFEDAGLDPDDYDGYGDGDW